MSDDPWLIKATCPSLSHSPEFGARDSSTGTCTISELPTPKYIQSEYRNVEKGDGIIQSLTCTAT
jgi:hypothetical protein